MVGIRLVGFVVGLLVDEIYNKSSLALPIPRGHITSGITLLTGRFVVMIVVVGLLVPCRIGFFVEVPGRAEPGLVDVDVGRVDGRLVGVRFGFGRLVVDDENVGRLIVVGRLVEVMPTVVTTPDDLFSCTKSAKSSKFPCNDSTILLTNKPILSFSKSSSTNCGVEMS